MHIPGKSDREKPLTLKQEMQRYIRQQLSQMAVNNEMESFEEADDFEVDDELPDITTPYTVIEMHPDIRAAYDLEPESPSLPGDQGGEAAEGSEATETPEPARVAK